MTMRKVVQVLYLRFDSEFEVANLDVEFRTEAEAEAWILENGEAKFGGRMSDMNFSIRTIYTDSKPTTRR